MERAYALLVVKYLDSGPHSLQAFMCVMFLLQCEAELGRCVHTQEPAWVCLGHCRPKVCGNDQYHQGHRALLSSEKPQSGCGCAGETSWPEAYSYSQGLYPHHRSPF